MKGKLDFHCLYFFFEVDSISNQIFVVSHCIQPYLLTFSVSISIFFALGVSIRHSFDSIFDEFWIFYFIGQGVWIPGFGIALLSYSQLYILCDIGNEVDSAVWNTMSLSIEPNSMNSSKLFDSFFRKTSSFWSSMRCPGIFCQERNSWITRIFYIVFKMVQYFRLAHLPNLISRPFQT